MNIIWLRNDLRITNNFLIQKANELKEKYLIIYILNQQILSETSEKRKDFLFSSLSDLNNSLTKYNSRLLILNNPYSFVLGKISGVKKVIVSKDYSNLASKRDKICETILTNKDIEYIKINNNYLFDDFVIENKNHKPFQIFTFFKKDLLNKLESYKFNSAEIDKSLLMNSNEIDEFIKKNELSEFKLDPSYIDGIGENSGLKLLDSFIEKKVSDYAAKRNIPSYDETSRLSPYLKFGCLSPHFILFEILKNIGKNYADIRKITQFPGHDSFISEIIWRDFYKYIFKNFPLAGVKSFNSKYEDIKWNNDMNFFKAWCQGQTGYPIVDAFMKQLNKTGWMHNRGRMIVGSFLVKDLHIDWKWGEKYFKEKLIDFDIASNNGGWQWVAGTGTDASPYFRIFNPVEQSKKFDPDGKFIKTFLPNLKFVPEKYIHEPWKMPVNLQKEIKVIIGKDYPEPIVDHDLARKKTLEMYKR